MIRIMHVFSLFDFQWKRQIVFDRMFVSDFLNMERNIETIMHQYYKKILFIPLLFVYERFWTSGFPEKDKEFNETQYFSLLIFELKYTPFRIRCILSSCTKT